MLYGSTPWSCLPLSTIKPQIPNGEEFDYDLIIDQLLGNELCIQQQTINNLNIYQSPLLSVIVDQYNEEDLYVQQQKDFTLIIDKTYDLELEFIIDG